MAKVKYPLETAFDAYQAINNDEKVLWVTNNRGTFEITKDDPIYEMLASHIGNGAAIYGFWKEIEE